jgi:hypothetical protein
MLSSNVHSYNEAFLSLCLVLDFFFRTRSATKSRELAIDLDTLAGLTRIVGGPYVENK